MTGKLRPPVKWFGGKYYLAERIISLFGPHSTYVEPFGGAASVLLNKPPARVEVYNDLDGAITRLFRILRDHGDELARRLTLSPYSEIEFQVARTADDVDDIELARRDYVRWRQSLAGQGKAFSYSLHRSRKGMADVVSGYLSSIDEDLPIIVERLRQVQILQRPALDVIKKWDSADTLLYCDPPYLHSTRNARTLDVYGVELSEEDHKELASVLHSCIGQVIVSGYPSELYEILYKNWIRQEVEVPNHASLEDNKSMQREVLWLNREGRNVSRSLFG